MWKRSGWGSIVVMFFGVSWGLAQEIELAAPAVVAGGTPSGTDVLARGPVHEAFAEMISPDPEPGLIVPKAPPEPIEEVPPEWRPEGDDIEWIPGYWFWDEDRNDFVWVSGVWRRIPPSRRWVPGYWQAVASGHQWTPGFWGAAENGVVTYLDAPPESLDTGPSSPAPAEEMFWIPGNWEYHVAAYRWRPGHWHPFRADWTWVSARFIWTPRGYVLIPGYWDYTLTRRGFLFAPVYFTQTVYLRPGFSYRPTYWIGADAMLLHLFVSPVSQHLYFGDYYATQYRQRNYIPCFDYHARHQGFASLYVYYQHHYRHHGIDYCHRVRQWHDTYARRADLRPPHTYNIQRQHAAAGSRDLFTDVVRPFHADGGVERSHVGGQRLVPIAGRDRDLMRSETKRMRSLASERSHFEIESRTAHGATSRIAKGKREFATFQLPEAPQEIVRSRSFKKAPPTLTFSPDSLTKRHSPDSPDRQTAGTFQEGTNRLQGNGAEALRKRTLRLPLASDSNVESSDLSATAGGVANGGAVKGRPSRRPGFNPDALGQAAGTTDAAATSGGEPNGGVVKGRPSRRPGFNPDALGQAAGTTDAAATSGGEPNGGVVKGRPSRRLGFNPDALGQAAGTTDAAATSGGEPNGGVVKGRPSRRPGFNPDALGQAAGTTDAAATSGGGGDMKGRSLRRRINSGLDSAGSAGVPTSGADASSTGTQLPFSSAQTRMKAQLPPAARKALQDAASRRDNLNLDSLRMGNQGSGKRVRSGVEAGAVKGSAGNIGSETRSGDGQGSSEGAARGSSRFRSGGKGKGRGSE